MLLLPGGGKLTEIDNVCGNRLSIVVFCAFYIASHQIIFSEVKTPFEQFFFFSLLSEID